MNKRSGKYWPMCTKMRIKQNVRKPQQFKEINNMQINWQNFRRQRRKYESRKSENKAARVLHKVLSFKSNSRTAKLGYDSESWKNETILSV